MEPVILVGVANTGLRRMAEYTPTRDYKLGGGEGRSYGRLLADELKPLVDAAYRTLSEPGDTAVGGSSLGGLISLFFGLERPDVFGRIAVISPSIWWDQRSILTFINQAVPKPNLRIWLDIGTAEGCAACPRYGSGASPAGAARMAGRRRPGVSRGRGRGPR